MDKEIRNLQNRYQDAVQDSVGKLDKEFLRKMQADHFRCGIKCCENNSLTSDEMQECLTRCSHSVADAQSVIENELNSFQNRLQRCMMDCSEKVKDKIPANTPESEMSKYEKQVQECAKNCVDSQLKTNLPALMQRLRSKLSSYKAPL